MNFLTPEMLGLLGIALGMVGGYIKIEKRMITLEVQMKVAINKLEKMDN